MFSLNKSEIFVLEKISNALSRLLTKGVSGSKYIQTLDGDHVIKICTAHNVESSVYCNGHSSRFCTPCTCRQGHLLSLSRVWQSQEVRLELGDSRDTCRGARARGNVVHQSGFAWLVDYAFHVLVLGSWWLVVHLIGELITSVDSQPFWSPVIYLSSNRNVSLRVGLCWCIPLVRNIQFFFFSPQILLIYSTLTRSGVSAWFSIFIFFFVSFHVFLLHLIFLFYFYFYFYFFFHYHFHLHLHL